MAVRKQKLTLFFTLTTVALLTLACAPNSEEQPITEITAQGLDPGRQQQCRWQVTGTLRVEDAIWHAGSIDGDAVLHAGNVNDVEGLTGSRRVDNAIYPLRGALVTLKYQRPGGTYQRLATALTDERGRFSFDSAHDCGRQRLRVLVSFDNDDLSLRKALGVQHSVRIRTTEWFDDNAIRVSYDAGTFTFDQRQFEDGTLARSQWRAANIFWGVTRLMRRLSDEGVPYLQKLTIRYPAESVCAPGCAVPSFGVVMIRDGWFTGSANWVKQELIHEVLHFWYYQRTQGSISMLSGHEINSHERRESEFVALAEGLAEFMARRIMGLWYGTTYTLLVKSRYSLGVLMDLPTWDDVIHNDSGVMAVLNRLLVKRYHDYDFGTLSSPPSETTPSLALPIAPFKGICPDANFTLFELLRAFDPIASPGLTTRMTGAQGIDHFLLRLSVFYPARFGATVRDHFKNMLDPAPTVVRHPQELCRRVLVGKSITQATFQQQGK